MRIVAQLGATFALSLQVLGRRVLLFTWRASMEGELSALFSVNAAGPLCAGVGSGSIRAPGLPLPARLIDMLYEHLRTAVAAIPIAYFPAHIDLPEASELLGDEVQLQISNVVVPAQAVTLELQLFFGPNASLIASDPVKMPGVLPRLTSFGGQS